jgi:hypothetical protein
VQLKAIFVCLIAIVALVVVVRSCDAGSHLNVDPNARHEIEKAKHR